MKIEIWSDYACPFCYMGKRRFEQALNQFADKNNVEVIYRSFELDPNAKRDVDYDVHDMLAGKYGMTRERAIAMNNDVTEQAKSLGLQYRLDTAIQTNTFDAHRLTHFAAKQGKAAEMTELLFKAYFTDSKHIGDHAVLSALAGQVGLDEQTAAAMLSRDDYAVEVKGDEQEAAELEIRAVPFFLIDRKYAITGAQPAEVFLETLLKVSEAGPSESE
ncbi:DsbA family oxidoreductase [Paenibacillus zeisoli]|uniref:DsbA family oxidoreductase n=1 Tax=Paenibacillus zeisoli TaxID=2496267 RepID=A0A433X2D7_9BACL|nr:DsbA family oxidoreductase [Paenibacillus zeisoli]RUT28102.1 DsbA family oxidoreductase [Paenibacillus zeisoli]